MNSSNESISTQILNNLFKGANLHDLICILSNFFQSPIALYDSNRLPIECSDDFPEESFYDHINMRKKMYETENSSIQSFLNDIHQKAYSEKAHFFTYKFVRTRYLWCSCIYQDHFLGVLSIPDTNEHFDEIDHETFEIAAKAMATALVLNHSPNNEKDLTNTQLLWGCLNHKYPPAFLTRDVLWNAFDNVEEFMILWTPLTSHIDLEIPFKHCWHVKNESGWILLIDALDTKNLQQFHRLSQKAQLLFSSSSIFSDFQKMSDHVELAQRVYGYAKQMDQLCGVAKYEDYRICEILNCAKKNMSYPLLHSEILDSIKNYDQINHSEYFLTLKAYLFCNMDYLATADKLCIHKNTVIYRIKKIHELFQINLEDIKQITSLYISMILE